MTTIAIKTLGALGALAAGAAFSLGASVAAAGECPEDQVIAGSMTAEGHTASSGATDTVLSAVRLGDRYPDLAGRDQRLRYLTVEPGGEVAWHSHADRPALIYMIEGEMTEYRSDCGVPIEHKAGDVAAEQGPIEHWWKNNGASTARLISADLPRSQ